MISIFFLVGGALIFSCSPCSKAILMFEDDERFKAVERPREREDLFESYLVELHKKVLTSYILNFIPCDSFHYGSSYCSSWTFLWLLWYCFQFCVLSLFHSLLSKYYTFEKTEEIDSIYQCLYAYILIAIAKWKKYLFSLSKYFLNHN